MTAAVDIYEDAGRKQLVISEWTSHFRGRGHSVAALRWFRAQGFSQITANGVGTLDPDPDNGVLVGDIATTYWAHMHSLGLVDTLLDDNHRQLHVDSAENLSFAT